MKTYEDFRDEVMERDFDTPVSYARIEELAAKEYAKQWVREALQNEPDSFIEHYLKQIDNQ